MARTSKSRGATPFQLRSGNSPHKFLGKINKAIGNAVQKVVGGGNRDADEPVDTPESTNYGRPDRSMENPDNPLAQRPRPGSQEWRDRKRDADRKRFAARTGNIGFFSPTRQKFRQRALDAHNAAQGIESDSEHAEQSGMLKKEKNKKYE
tara:strand:+ start:38 stop:487 length:450 start_codon:yes stop_codon:yes gene_type:complete